MNMHEIIKIQIESDTSHHLHCYQPSLGQHHLSPGPLRKTPDTSPYFYSCSSSLFCTQQAKEAFITVNQIKSSSTFPSHLAESPEFPLVHWPPGFSSFAPAVPSWGCLSHTSHLTSFRTAQKTPQRALPTTYPNGAFSTLPFPIPLHFLSLGHVTLQCTSPYVMY